MGSTLDAHGSGRGGAVDTERARREIVERDLQVIHHEFLEAHKIDCRRMAPLIGPHYNCNAFVEEVTPAKNDGVLPPNMTQERLIFTTLLAPGKVFLLQAKVVGRNAADDVEKSTAQSEATRMLPPLMRFLREYIPGFERVHLIDIAPQIGVRETRRIIADHVLTEEEILNDRRFSDTIGLGGYYPDVHPPKGQDKTLASMVMGQAAGTAAALAARNSRSFHDLDIPDLQARLAKSGAFLHPEDADDRFEFAPLGPR